MKERVSILVVDDTESNADMLLAILKDYDVIPATSGEDALEIAKSEKLDLILLDILMPDINGYEVCKQLKEDQKTASIPVIFITAKNDEESIEKAYDIGGIDYVTKPFRPIELRARIKTQLQIMEMLKNLDFLASRDSLTGVLNRRKFFEKAEHAFEKESELYAIMMDIDRFKSINDRFGHHAGDEILKKITSMMLEHLGEEDIFGRLGGEEFAAICKRDSQEDLLKEVHSIKSMIENEYFLKEHDHVSITVSMGISKKDGETKNIDALLKKADNGLYEAKNSGRNRAIFRG